MKEDYSYAYSKDGVNVIVSIIALIFLVLVILVVVVMPDSDTERNIRVGILMIIIPLITFLISDLSAEADFSADDRAVTFSHMSQKIVIPYESIKSIDLKTEYREESIGGGVNKYYAEVITFHCADGKDHTFAGKLETDFEAILKDPNYLQKQTENSAFSRLKRYIDERIT